MNIILIKNINITQKQTLYCPTNAHKNYKSLDY